MSRFPYGFKRHAVVRFGSCLSLEERDKLARLQRDGSRDDFQREAHILVALRLGYPREENPPAESAK